MKRIAKVGEKIKVVNEGKNEWDKIVHPVDSVWLVKEVLLENCKPPGLVFLEGSDYGVFPEDYVVLEEI